MAPQGRTDGAVSPYSSGAPRVLYGEGTDRAAVQIMRLAILLSVLALTGVSTSARAACTASNSVWAQAEKLRDEMDDSRQNMKVLANHSGDPLDEMSWRIAHDDIELSFSFYSAAEVLTGLRGHMTEEADRRAFDPWIEQALKHAITSFGANADYLTTVLADTRMQALSAEATVLRDKARQMGRLLAACTS
jgi:hypothetical protein